MKINNDYPSTVCRVEVCPYRRSCANHISAGEYREEGGISPRLSVVGHEIHCSTCDIPSNDESVYGFPYRTEPIESHDMGYVEFSTLRPQVDPGSGI